MRILTYEVKLAVQDDRDIQELDVALERLIGDDESISAEMTVSVVRRKASASVAHPDINWGHEDASLQADSWYAHANDLLER